MGYAWYTIVPKDGLAANVAIASRIPDCARAHPRGRTVEGSKEQELARPGHPGGAGRDLRSHAVPFQQPLEVQDGGAKATEPSRLESASVLARRIGEILAQDPDADIVAAGDLNENVDEFARTGVPLRHGAHAGHGTPWHSPATSAPRRSISLSPRPRRPSRRERAGASCTTHGSR